jgi:hypothetical protein
MNVSNSVSDKKKQDATLVCSFQVVQGNTICNTGRHAFYNVKRAEAQAKGEHGSFKWITPAFIKKT